MTVSTRKELARRAAHRLYHQGGALEIDDRNAPIQEIGHEDGCYVGAWVWVRDVDIKAQETRERDAATQPHADVDPVKALRAVGLNPIVIDENTDFSKLPIPLADHKEQKTSEPNRDHQADTIIDAEAHLRDLVKRYRALTVILLSAARMMRNGWERNLTEAMAMLNEAIDTAESWAPDLRLSDSRG